MAEKMRKALGDDYEPLMRFLERSYGHPRNFFADNYGYVYETVCRRDGSSPGGCYIIEKDGRIVSHVGLYPVELVSGDVRITAGGIGNVGTLPEERGRGHMGKLLLRSIEEMDKNSMALSFLGGDRYRYGNYGWETSGEKLVVSFTRRSFEKSGVKPAEHVAEADPAEAASFVEKLHGRLAYRADRKVSMARMLVRRSNRVWVGEDGYLCAMRSGDKLVVNEVASSSGSEAGMILAAMNWCFLDAAEAPVCVFDENLKKKLLPAASRWVVATQGMFRINDCCALLKSFAGHLGRKAQERRVGDFRLSLGISGEERSTSVEAAGGRVRISEGKLSPHLELSRTEAARLLMGGPFETREELEPLAAVLPLPVYIPPLDRV